MFGKRWNPSTLGKLEPAAFDDTDLDTVEDVVVREPLIVEASDKEPFELKGLPSYQSYMPFVVFLPPPIRGQHAEGAEEIRHQFLQEALFTGERWHTRVEEIHLQRKIDQQKRDDFHLHISHVLDDLRHNLDADFWVSIMDEPKDSYVHKLIRDYLAANANNRPREPRPPVTADQMHFGAEPDIVISADDFLSQGCTQEPGVITSTLALTDDYIIYGPYRPYPVGMYEAVFDVAYESNVSTPGLTLTIDVAQNGSVVATAKFDSMNLAYNKKPKSVKITISNENALFEFRVHVSGSVVGAKIRFKGIRLFRQ